MASRRSADANATIFASPTTPSGSSRDARRRFNFNAELETEADAEAVFKVSTTIVAATKSTRVISSALLRPHAGATRQ